MCYNIWDVFFMVLGKINCKNNDLEIKMKIYIYFFYLIYVNLILNLSI